MELIFQKSRFGTNFVQFRSVGCNIVQARFTLSVKRGRCVIGQRRSSAHELCRDVTHDSRSVTQAQHSWNVYNLPLLSHVIVRSIFVIGTHVRWTIIGGLANLWWTTQTHSTMLQNGLDISHQV